MICIQCIQKKKLMSRRKQISAIGILVYYCTINLMLINDKLMHLKDNSKLRSFIKTQSFFFNVISDMFLNVFYICITYNIFNIF